MCRDIFSDRDGHLLVKKYVIAMLFPPLRSLLLGYEGSTLYPVLSILQLTAFQAFMTVYGI